jgi:hypothetical protein
MAGMGWEDDSECGGTKQGTNPVQAKHSAWHMAHGKWHAAQAPAHKRLLLNLLFTYPVSLDVRSPGGILRFSAPCLLELLHFLVVLDI